MGSLLIIDDDPNNLDIFRNDLEFEGYQIITAANGREGLSIVKDAETTINAILLDRMMPEMDGMEFLRRIKQEETLKNIPIIMQTASAEREKIREGIEAGAYYYLTKPYDVDIMRSVVRAAMNDYGGALREDVETFHPKFSLIKEGLFEIRTLEEARYLATFLANYYPEPARAAFGIAEMLTNGIEHGNLNIGYEEKTKLDIENKWEDEIRYRLSLPEYEHKRLEVHFVNSPEALLLTIQDEGDGFNWHPFMQLDPQRAMDSHGRGIAMANMMVFHEINYEGHGNRVQCIFHKRTH